MNPYRTVYFDIMGVCNAHCPYCHSGANRISGGDKVDPVVFRQGLERLLEAGAIEKSTVISTYNWGEPFLHPAVKAIVQSINELGLKHAWSTNASTPVDIDREFVQNLDHIIFSMSGFSQDSYNKIHGFLFDSIRQNIVRIVGQCRKNGFKGYFVIYFHVYRFNVHEMKTCEAFADSLGIVFRPYYAMLNNWWLIHDLLNDRMPPDEKQKAQEWLFNSDIQKVMKNSPKRYNCPQCDYLILDERANVLTCCHLPRNHQDYSCGSVMAEGVAGLDRGRCGRAVCRQCLDSGLAFYLNTSTKTPSFYKPSMKQRCLHLIYYFRKARQLSFDGVWRRIRS